MVYICLVSGIYVILFRGQLLVFMFGMAKGANDMLQYESCEMTWTKRTFKTKRYKQIQIYISSIHAIKYFKILVF